MPELLDSIDYSFKEILVDALHNSAYLYKEFKLQVPFGTTHNCYPSARWDAINESFSDAFQKENIPFICTKRGFWELLLFCDREKQVVVSAMREDRFNDICRNPEENAPRYFDSLVSLNADLEANASQTSLCDVYEATDKYNQLETLCKCLPIPANKYNHVVLLFSIDYDEISSIKLCVVNSKFEVVEEEDLLQQIVSNRSKETIIYNVENQESNDVPQRGFVKLKKNSTEKHSV